MALIQDRLGRASFGQPQDEKLRVLTEFTEEGHMVWVLKAEKIGKAGNGVRQRCSERGVGVSQSTWGQSACSDQERSWGKRQLILKGCLGLDHRFLGGQAGSLHFLLRPWGASGETVVRVEALMEARGDAEVSQRLPLGLDWSWGGMSWTGGGGHEGERRGQPGAWSSFSPTGWDPCFPGRPLAGLSVPESSRPEALSPMGLPLAVRVARLWLLG